MSLEAELGRTGRLSVRTSLCWHPDSICSQLKGKLQGTPVKNFLDQVIRSGGRSTLNVGGTFLVAAWIRKLCFGVFASSRTSKFMCSIAAATTGGVIFLPYYQNPALWKSNGD